MGRFLVFIVFASGDLITAASGDGVRVLRDSLSGLAVVYVTVEGPRAWDWEGITLLDLFSGLFWRLGFVLGRLVWSAVVYGRVGAVRVGATVGGFPALDGFEGGVDGGAVGL